VIVHSRDSRGQVWKLRTESEPVDGRTDTSRATWFDGGVRDISVSSFLPSLCSNVDGVAFGIGGISFIIFFYF
jgi:hypothetical protein